MEFYFKNGAIRRFIEEVADAYCSLYPQAAADFDQDVRDTERALIKPSAMSKDGHFLNFCHLPGHIYPYIKIRCRERFGIQDFWADPANYRLFCDIWTNCRIRRKETQYLFLKNAPVETKPTECPSPSA